MTVTNLTPPTLFGTFRKGQTVSTSNGTWDFDLDYLTYTYRWLRCDAAGANCNPIGGATASSYLLVTADVGSRIRSEVTATEHAPVVGRPPDPPSGYGGQVVISSGGDYEVAALTTGSTPAVIISTSQPVTLTGWVKNLSSGGTLIDAIPGGAVNLTVEGLWAYGAQTVPNNIATKRFLWTENHQSLVVRNCSIVNTGGIEISEVASGGTVLITKNRHTNVQGYVDNAAGVLHVGNFVQFRTVQNMASCEISWNEILNEYNKSWPEDVISIYHTDNVQVIDNFIRHQSTPGNAFNVSSQNTITIDASTSGPGASSNYVARNQLVDAMGIGTHVGFGGNNNLIEDNRIVQDGFLPGTSTKIGNGHTGLFLVGGGTNNHAHGNEVIYWGRPDSPGGALVRRDFLLTGAPEGAAAEEANNTSLSNPADEAAEWTSWQAKLTANGITVGA